MYKEIFIAQKLDEIERLTGEEIILLMTNNQFILKSNLSLDEIYKVKQALKKYLNNLETKIYQKTGHA